MLLLFLFTQNIIRSVFIMVKPVFVELDGQTKELRYDFNAMMKYEQMVGTGFQQ